MNKRHIAIFLLMGALLSTTAFPASDERKILASDFVGYAIDAGEFMAIYTFAAEYPSLWRRRGFVSQQQLDRDYPKYEQFLYALPFYRQYQTWEPSDLLLSSPSHYYNLSLKSHYVQLLKRYLPQKALNYSGIRFSYDDHYETLIDSLKSFPDKHSWLFDDQYWVDFSCIPFINYFW